MDERKNTEKHKEEIEKAITNVINEGSEDVTTLSEAPEAKYEAIDEKIINRNK